MIDPWLFHKALSITSLHYQLLLLKAIRLYQRLSVQYNYSCNRKEQTQRGCTAWIIINCLAALSRDFIGIKTTHAKNSHITSYKACSQTVCLSYSSHLDRSAEVWSETEEVFSRELLSDAETAQSCWTIQHSAFRMRIDYRLYLSKKSILDIGWQFNMSAQGKARKYSIQWNPAWCWKPEGNLRHNAYFC